jgi:hypothetical protein
LPPSPVIDGCKTAVLQPLAFVTGAKLDVFTELAEGPASVAELAERIRADQDWLSPLLFALVAAGFLIHEEGKFRNSEEADHFLVRGRPHFIGDVHKLFEDLWLGAFRAAESVKAGKPLAAHDYGGMNDEALDAFFQGQHPDSLLAGWKLADAFDFSAARRLVDIGGGSGGVGIALCQRYSSLSGTVADLPGVARIADRYIAEAGCDNRLRTVGCDLLSGPLPGTFDVAVMRALLQVLGPPECRKLLCNVRPALAPGAKLFIIGQIIDDDRTHPETVATFNLIFLSFYGHHGIHTESEHRDWLETAGFHDIERKVTANGLNMMVAHA